ncbi:hypothetical protein ALC60_04869 [Trachymyrmex zeteki]|uniref:Uncharacterized protein n=1 Tax=Mycetomoellerius zeteki TaxID=64791 RepID=A0A151X7A4_9HYME|nr:hypothetical protein ALC60_04869 [Trachymyrmex zeteki]
MYILAPDSLEFSTAEEARRPIPGTCSTLPLMLFFSDQTGVRRARWEISLSYSRASGLQKFNKNGHVLLYIGPRKPCPFFFLAGLSFGPLVNVPFGKEQKYRPRGAHIPPKPLENGCPMAEMFIPRTREIWNAATCSTYVNCSAKQAAPLAFRSAPSRFTPRLHYTISNKPEYCILRSRVFRSSGFSSARVQWNVRIRFIFCRKICTGISVDESELSFVSRRKK